MLFCLLTFIGERREAEREWWTGKQKGLMKREKVYSGFPNAVEEKAVGLCHLC